MALDPKAGAKLRAFIDGSAVVYASSVSLAYEDGKTPIVVMDDGYVGETPGAGQYAMQLSGPVLNGAEDFDFLGACKGDPVSYHTVQVSLGNGRVFTGKGSFFGFSTSRSVNGSTEFSVSWRGSGDTA